MLLSINVYFKETIAVCTFSPICAILNYYIKKRQYLYGTVFNIFIEIEIISKRN